MSDYVLSSPHPPNPEPGAVLLETDRLILRRWRSSDAESLAQIGNYEEVAKNLSHRFPYPYTLDAANAALARWLDLSALTDVHYPTSVALCLKPSSPDQEPTLIGSMGLSPGEGIEYRTWTLGYFLTPAFWRQGYMSEAVTGLAKWSFETWPRLNRIEATCYHWNEGTQGVLRKCGFVREGLRRGATEKGGVLNDDVMYGLLRSDLEKAE
ncbi:hypothetical protein NLU13_2301 [Sarocladium strictum]|uniref:N-acetyltransferase domain-containing protein n=1 Tax=Sarocladium strictum TaxID=5046 RepID=A0AA39LCJ9_SARSR|nr:hypothetical protein NLU13_2301 [Sarocladium strictum]